MRLSFNLLGVSSLSAPKPSEPSSNFFKIKSAAANRLHSIIESISKKIIKPKKNEPTERLNKNFDSRKVLIRAAAVASIVAVVASGILAYNFKNSHANYVSVDSILRQNQCPALEVILEEQEITGINNWNIENLNKWFGSERDLTLVEARYGLYSDLKNCIPDLAKIMEKKEGGLNKESARVVSEFRGVVREYTRNRSWELVDKYLSWAEPRDSNFEFYWEKYKQDPLKIIEKAQTSNSTYDSPWLLELCDKVLSGWGLFYKID